MDKAKVDGLAIMLRWKFSHVKKGNFEPIFARRFNEWQFKYSDTKELSEGDDYLEFNDRGDITNGLYSKINKQGLELTEKDFIKYEIEELNKRNRSALRPDQKVTFDGYLKYLESRISNPKNVYPNIFVGTDNNNFEKFDFLYNNLDGKEKSNLSALYHFFKDGHLFNPTMSQEKYIQWCLETYDETLSKVFPKNHKMEEVISKSIPALLSNFK